MTITPVSLSRIHGDYAQLVAQFQIALAGKDTWKDVVPTATGEAIISFLASIGDFSQFSIEQAYKEGFLDYARRPTSIYAAARHLGVRVGRKIPASTLVNLGRTDTSIALTLPPYSQFSYGNVFLFNREAITFPIGVATVTDIAMYEGSVQVYNVTSDGSDYQQFVSVEDAFSVANDDVAVYVDYIQIPVLQKGLWHAKNTAGVQNKTTADGKLQLIFGSAGGGTANYGTVPAINASILIVYAVTNGLDANDASAVGRNVSYAPNSTITGTLTTGLSSGFDQRDSIFYKKFGPQLFAADGGAVTKDQFAAVAASYPGVYDALVVGQRELSPYNNAYMNLVRVSLLTDPPMTNSQWDDFSDFYRQNITYPTRFYREDPQPVPVDVTATVSCFNQADLTLVKANIESSLTDLFALKVGIISRNFYRSDIFNAIKNADPRVDFIQMDEPTLDVFPNLQPPKEPTLTEVVGGTLAALGYVYVITAINGTGETLATNYAALTTTGLGSVKVDWEPVNGATAYSVYGRTGTGGLLATVSSTTLTFTDDGSIIPFGSVPQLDTTGVHYATLGTVTLTMQYSGRIS